MNATGSAVAYATYARNVYALTADSIYVPSSDKNRVLEKTALSVQPAGTITCVANAATFSEGGMAPGEIVSIFGSGIGPEMARSAELDGTGKISTSLGGVESLIEHRASVEGADSPCPPDLLRLSVGLEDPDDLFADLDQALRAARPA